MLEMAGAASGPEQHSFSASSTAEGRIKAAGGDRAAGGGGCGDSGASGGGGGGGGCGGSLCSAGNPGNCGGGAVNGRNCPPPRGWRSRSLGSELLGGADGSSSAGKVADLPNPWSDPT